MHLAWNAPLGGLSLHNADRTLGLEEGPPSSLLLLRVGEAERAAVTQAIGVMLPRMGVAHVEEPAHGPIRGNTLAVLAAGERYLIKAAIGHADAIAAEIASALAATEHQLVDVTHATATLILSGTVEPVLSRVSTLDLRAFRPGDVAAAPLARVPATLWRQEDGCEIYVPASRALFVAAHLARAGHVLGLPALALPERQMANDGGLARA
ncbi:hypothetical protein [Acuticoccus kandeliae]|uniref:hypothetical protein n=1 Tax=Acuticoccus kandeliae TaxID=2073160 RepID=UPI000D3E7B3E|nr:hypothetical protein [Acuticoccus kandeliae]